MKPIALHDTKHPNEIARVRYQGLVGIDSQKAELLEHLMRVFDPQRLIRWQKTHHPKGLRLMERMKECPHLVILGGEVGCGKTALAISVGTPVAEAIDRRVVALETPSDIRGGGLVGQLSERITAAFEEARAGIGQNAGILIIDEADDLGTSRAQMQAHHEDRAGVNVLIKEIDRIAREAVPLAVLLVTNRLNALDPALVRRAQVIRFTRPDASARRALFEHLLADVVHDPKDLDALVRSSKRKPLFSYSDLVVRGIEAALLVSIRENKPLSAATLQAVIAELEPSPEVEDANQ